MQHVSKTPGLHMINYFDRNAYPSVKFWSKKDFIDAKKKRRTSTGLKDKENEAHQDNRITWFVETVD